MTQEEICTKMRHVAYTYEWIEDYVRAINAYLLAIEWGSKSPVQQLKNLSADYPQTVFNSALQNVEEGLSSNYIILGYCYENGRGTVRNMDKAVECYRKYLKNHSDAELEASLGVCYYKGLYGLEKDDEKAFSFFKKAGDKSKKYTWLTGFCYYKGIGCERNWQKAADILSQCSVEEIRYKRFLEGHSLQKELDETFYRMVENQKRSAKARQIA